MSLFFVVSRSLSLGAGHTLALQPKLNNSVWGTGDNGFGQLGINKTSAMSVKNFVKVLPGGAKIVAAGGRHSMVLMHDGSVWSTGSNKYGQLGDESNTDRDHFMQVIPSHAKAVAAGARHSLAVMKDGSVWATGYNRHGQLGDGSKSDSNKFLEVMSLGARTVAAGIEHSLVLKLDGSVWATGENKYGQLGDGTTGLKSSLIQVISAGENDYAQRGDGSEHFEGGFVKVMSDGAKAIAAGSRHSMVLKNDGSVWVTGDNDYGQLGYGSVYRKSSFVEVIFSGVKAIAVGYDHSVVLKQDGSVWATGRNNLGQLGNRNYKSSRFTNTFLKVFSSGAKVVAGGGYHSMVLKRDYSLWAAGGNMHGQLGDGTTVDKSIFVHVVLSQEGMWERWYPVCDGLSLGFTPVVVTRRWVVCSVIDLLASEHIFALFLFN